MNEPTTESKDMKMSLKSLRIVVLVIVALAIIGFLCLHYTPVGRPLTLGLASAMMPKDLHDAQFLTGESRSQRDSFGFSSLPDEEGSTLGVDRAGGAYGTGGSYEGRNLLA